jgi:hypothetical protein
MEIECKKPQTLPRLYIFTKATTQNLNQSSKILNILML